MSIKLKFDLVKEIVQHGAKAGPQGITDPSASPLLRKAGVAMVTTYVEQLALLDLVRNPRPIFGSDGGMWIGYSLSEEGIALSRSEQRLRLAVADLTGDPRSEVSRSVEELREECKLAQINPNYREEFLHTLEEIAICFDNECYIAAIGLCGKILEVCLKEILIRHGVGFEPNVMVGMLIRSIKERASSEYIDPALTSIADIVNQSRITAVHAKERIPIPSRDQAVMVIFATRDVVRRNLSHMPPAGD